MFQTTKQFVIIFFCNDHLVREKPPHVMMTIFSRSPTRHGPNVQGGGPPVMWTLVNISTISLGFMVVISIVIVMWTLVNISSQFHKRSIFHPHKPSTQTWVIVLTCSPTERVNSNWGSTERMVNAPSPVIATFVGMVVSPANMCWCRKITEN